MADLLALASLPHMPVLLLELDLLCQVALHLVSRNPHLPSRQTRLAGALFISPVQGEVNPPCTKVFLRKTLVRRTGGDGRRCVQAVSFLRT